MIWFSADHHFAHDEIITYCMRPFRNPAVMHKHMTREHNSLVAPSDDAYFIGDISMLSKSHRGTIENYIRKFNGRLHLIIGSHDIRDPVFWTEVGFTSVHYPYLEVEEFVLVHDVAASQVDRTRPFLCGHVHDLFIHQKNVLNVGVDVWDFKPVSIDQVREYFRKYMNIKVKGGA